MAQQNQEPIVTLSDLLNLCRRFKKQILTSTICFSTFASLYTLTNPVYYWAEGMFRDKGSTSAGMSDSFSAALVVSKMGGASLENEATTTMKSRTLLVEVAKRLHMNGNIAEVNPLMIKWVYLPRILDNIYVEYRLFTNPFNLFFPDAQRAVSLENIEYKGEEPYGGIVVQMLSEENFEIKDPRQGMFEGKIGEPVKTDRYSFTLVKKNKESISGKHYSIGLTPLEMQANTLGNYLNIKADKEDKTLVRIGCTTPDRNMTAKVINTLMEVYQDFKKDESKRIAEAQLEYLAERHTQLNGLLGVMMTEHAQNISKDLLKIGFPNAQTAIDFLANNQSQHQQRLLTIDLEMKRLEQAKSQGYSFFDYYTPHGDPGIINSITGEIRELKKQSDNLQLTLQQSPELDPEEQKRTIAKYVTELDQIAAISDAAQTLLVQVKDNQIPETINPLLDNSKYLIKSWWLQLQEASPYERDKIRGQFVAYMEQLIRLFDVHFHSLEERLTRHQNPQVEFEGVDLVSARELYISYSKLVHELEAQAMQHQYVLGEMQNPEFEITSLSTLLNDAVSHDMITQTSKLILQLKETHSRSAREQQRIREEIEVKKGFLAMHLKNAGQLLSLRQNLMREKIHSLQDTTLGLLQQQISLLERHLADYLTQRIKDLHQEREVLIQHQRDLNSQMVTLPTKLSEEKIIDQQLRINTGVAEEVSRLIESKNLASNLEVNRSVPVEVAVPPIRPKSPRLLFFAIFGAFLGFFFNMTYLVARTMMRGMPVSRDNLRASGYNVAGALTPDFDYSSQQPMRDTDLETIRNITTFLPMDKKNHSLFICEGKGPNFSCSIGQLLAKRKLKVILVHLSFTEGAKQEDGLLQYLQGETSHPKIVKGPNYDEIMAGGVTRFSNELIASQQFLTLMDELIKEYDWVIGVSKGRSVSAETKDLLPLFDYAVLAMSDETIQELLPAIEMNNATFIA